MTGQMAVSSVPALSAAERLYRDANDRLEKNFFNTMHPDS